MIQDFKETDHPRDKDGKFASGSSETSADKTGTGTETIKSKEIIVKGNELGEYRGIKELRKLAIDYYKSNIQRTSIKRDDIGEINFSNKGIKETISHSGNNENKLKCIPVIKDIILSGKVGKEEKPNHPRNDYIESFIPINKEIAIDGEVKNVEILIYKQRDGKFYYDLYVDFKRKIRETEPATKAGNFSNCNQTIPSTNEKVNSFIIQCI